MIHYRAVEISKVTLVSLRHINFIIAMVKLDSRLKFRHNCLHIGFTSTIVFQLRT